jgi:tetratricopeptide (TPR) repeat protein
LLDEQGRTAEALATVREALAISRVVFIDEHPSIARLLTTYGSALLDAGEVEEAHAVFEDALARKRKQFGEDHVELAASLRGLALASLRRGETHKATDAMQRAEALTAAAHPPHHPHRLRITAAAAQVEAALGHHEAALRKAEAVLEPLQKHGGNGVPAAKLRFTMAQSLRALGRDEPRARALAEQAREALVGRDSSLLAEVIAFLAAPVD